jgi:hypothetical protein
MAKKNSTKKREVRELSASELEQISAGASSSTDVLADAKHGLADAKRSFVDIKAKILGNG